MGVVATSHEHRQAIQFTETPSQEGGLNFHPNAHQLHAQPNFNLSQLPGQQRQRAKIQTKEASRHHAPPSEDRQFLNIAKKINEASGSFQTQIPYFNVPHSFQSQPTESQQQRSSTHILHS